MVSENKSSAGRLLLFRVAFAEKRRSSLRLLRNCARSPPGREAQLQMARLRFFEMVADSEISSGNVLMSLFCLREEARLHT